MTESTEPAGPHFPQYKQKTGLLYEVRSQYRQLPGALQQTRVKGDWRETLGPGKKERESQPITQAILGLTSQISHQGEPTEVASLKINHDP